MLRRTHGHHRDIRTVEAAARTARHNGAEPGKRPMTRHGPSAHTAASRWRRSTGCHVHVAVGPVVPHTNPVGNNATGSASWPGSRFHDMPTAPFAEVRDKRWHTPKHKTP